MILYIILVGLLISIAHILRSIWIIYDTLPVEKKNTVAFVRYKGWPIALLPIGLIERYFLETANCVMCVFTDQQGLQQNSFVIFANTAHDVCEIGDLQVVLRIVMAVGEKPRDAIRRFLRPARLNMREIQIRKPKANVYTVIVPQPADYYLMRCVDKFAQLAGCETIDRYIGHRDPCWVAYLNSKKN